MTRKRRFDLATIGCALGAIACVVAGAARYVEATPRGLRIDADHNLGLLTPNEEREIQVAVSNPTDEPITIMGSEGHCGRGFCVDAAGVPMVVPARESKRLRVKLRVTDVPGTYKDTLTIYTNAPGSTEVVLNFEGRIPELPPG